MIYSEVFGRAAAKEFQPRAADQTHGHDPTRDIFSNIYFPIYGTASCALPYSSFQFSFSTCPLLQDSLIVWAQEYGLKMVALLFKCAQ